MTYLTTDQFASKFNVARATASAMIGALKLTGQVKEAYVLRDGRRGRPVKVYRFANRVQLSRILV